MRTLLAATAVSALLFAPVGAHAQKSQQETTSEQDLRESIKAEPSTPKRENILRSETNRNDTLGAPAGH
ncbi:MAG TPA: hypothetical protein VII40_20220 [Xanthobacteraceae bacterium]|jgi:hypothetical protein